MATEPPPSADEERDETPRSADEERDETPRSADEERDETPRSADEERDETPLQRLDRNTVELLNELRVVGAGIQVLFGFLLVVPFNSRFPRLTSFERALYLVSLVCIAVSTILLIAPTVQHRLLFQQGQKPFLVATGTRLMVIASAFLGVGMTAIVLLVAKIVAGLAVGIVLSVLVAAVIGGLWFALPLRRRHALGRRRDRRRG